MKTKPGHYYGPDRAGRFAELPAGEPDAVLCRRVADFPDGKVPGTGAAVTTCADCGAPIVYATRGPHQWRPKICMQCGGIAPLPLDS